MIILDDVYGIIQNRKIQYEKMGILLKFHEDEIEFIAPFSRGIIHFWRRYNAIEENIFDLNQHIVYHLTYEVESMEQVLNLLAEFNHNLMNPRLRRKKIVISCQTRRTASIWASKLATIAEAFNLDLRFYPLEIYKLKDDAFMYDLIVLTPQVKYLEKAVQKYSNTPVLCVNMNLAEEGSFFELFHKIQSILD